MLADSLVWPHAEGLSRRLRAFLLRVLVCLACLPAAAAAQGVSSPAESIDTRARVAFEAAREAYDHGRFDEAANQFELAYTINAHPKLLFNIGRSAEFDGQRARAIQAYRQYLAAIPEADNREFVEARIAKLKAEAQSVDARAKVPSAETTARRAMPLEVMPSPLPTRADGDERAFYKRGWFWGVVGGAVAAGVATALVLTLRKDGPDRAEVDDRWLTLEGRP